MNDYQIDDLKQFISSTVSQAEERLQGEIGELRKEVTDSIAGVGEAIEEIHNQLDKHDTEVDKRLAKLEQQAA